MSEKGPSLKGWKRINEQTGFTGKIYGLYLSPDDKLLAHLDEEDGETVLILDRATSIIKYIHPNTRVGAKQIGFDLKVGSNFREVIENWLKGNRVTGIK